MPIKGDRIEDGGIREPKLNHQIAGISQHLMVWEDDFCADALDTTYWTSGGTGTGFSTPSTNTIGGTVTGVTGGTSTQTATLTFDEGVFSTSYPFGIEFRAKLSSLSSVEIQMGLRQDANDYAWFKFDTGTHASNIYCSIQTAGGGDISADSGTDIVADTYNIYRIEMYDATNRYVRYYIDDQLVEDSANFTTATGIASSTTFVPYFYIITDEDVTKTLTLDYVKVWQLRDKTDYSYKLV